MLRSRSGAALAAFLVSVTGCKDEKKTDVNTATGAGSAALVEAGAADAASAAVTDAVAEAGVDGDTKSAPHADDTSATDGGAKKAHHADGGAGLDTAGEADGGHARPKAVNVDEGSAGKTLELAAGQSLVVMLAATPSTGFDWDVVKAPPALSAPDMGFVQGGEQPGAPGKRRLTFVVKTALPAGEHELVLGYARSFEKGVAPFKTFKIKLRASK